MEARWVKSGRHRGGLTGELAGVIFCCRSLSTISRELRRNAATRGGGLEYRAHTTELWIPPYKNYGCDPASVVRVGAPPLHRAACRDRLEPVNRAAIECRRAFRLPALAQLLSNPSHEAAAVQSCEESIYFRARHIDQMPFSGSTFPWPLSASFTGVCAATIPPTPTLSASDRRARSSGTGTSDGRG